MEAAYQPPFANKFPPASPLIRLVFGSAAPKSAPDIVAELEAGDPSIVAAGSSDSITVGPQTLQDGEAGVIADRLRAILT